MAWSFDARRKQRPMCGQPHAKNCANCLPYALTWRRNLVTNLADSIPRHPQLGLWDDDLRDAA